MDKDLILNKIKLHYKFNSDVDFANFLGISTTRLSNWRKRNTLDYELISTVCEDINANWLLTGKGEMLKDKSIEPINKVQESSPIYNKVDYKSKYYELLEENRELRLKIDKQAKELEKLKDTHQKQVQETEKCHKELAKFRKEKNNNTMLSV